MRKTFGRLGERELERSKWEKGCETRFGKKGEKAE